MQFTVEQLNVNKDSIKIWLKMIDRLSLTWVLKNDTFYLVAKYFCTSKAGCSENCLKFKMPKIMVFCRFYLNFTD